jgi:hypothetical protein
MCPRKEGIIAVGEIVDMMLDGTLCECCGAFIDDDDDASGFPRYCSDNVRETEAHYLTNRNSKKKKTT